MTTGLRVRKIGLAATAAAALAGCARFQAKPSDQYVYVTAKQANLRDRVAAVSNRTGQVENGERLKVLERGRHSVRVQTPKGEVGWIEEKMVATGEVTGTFDKLRDDHKDDTEVASAVVRDQVYMHSMPGRDTDRFFLLNEGDKLKLLRRASVEKATSGPSAAKAQRAIPQAAGSNAARKDAAPAVVAGAVVPPVFEDWWLARDAAGHTGWVYARMMDVDAPDALTRYSEGQRFVGAYVLTTVHDDQAPGDLKDIPVYVTVLSPYKAGLPYDFDQVRVFTWSMSHHRYETGFRQKNVEGYLPVTVSRMKDPAEKGGLGGMELPAFSYKLLAADSSAAPDPATGEMKPGKTVTRTYRLEGNLVRRVGSTSAEAWSGPAEEVAHPLVEQKKAKKSKR